MNIPDLEQAVIDLTAERDQYKIGMAAVEIERGKLKAERDRLLATNRDLAAQISEARILSALEPAPITEHLDKVAAAIWPEIGADYTWAEALDRASGKVQDDEHSQAHHRQATEWARDLARAALAAIKAEGGEG